MVATINPQPPFSAPPSSSCPCCGYNASSDSSPAEHKSNALADARARIVDLESQVCRINEKAAAAIDRWADYEDELSRLRAALQQSQQQNHLLLQQLSPITPDHPLSSAPPPRAPKTNPALNPARSSFLPAGAATRISALLSSRKSTPNLRSPHGHGHASVPVPLPVHGYPHVAVPPSPTPSLAMSTEDLIEALGREQSRRVAAEGRLSATSREVEELSVSLFEQANEMVAEERRARARLEERITVLEQRENEKRRRLERLDSAMHRIERVREILAEKKDEPPAPQRDELGFQQPEAAPPVPEKPRKKTHKQAPPRREENNIVPDAVQEEVREVHSDDEEEEDEKTRFEDAKETQSPEKTRIPLDNDDNGPRLLAATLSQPELETPSKPAVRDRDGGTTICEQVSEEVPRTETASEPRESVPLPVEQTKDT